MGDGNVDDVKWRADWGEFRVAARPRGEHLRGAMGSGMNGCLTLGSFPFKGIVQTSPLSSPFADV